MKKTTLTVGLTALIGLGAAGTQAATLNNGDRLVVSSGVEQLDSNGYVVNIASGSFFVMDLSGDSNIQPGEKNAITVLNPIIIGASMAPFGFDTWEFSSATGTHYQSAGITGSTTAGLDFSGWTVNWNNGDIDMSGGAWQPGNCGLALMAAHSCTGYTFANGVADFKWSGIYGDTFTAWYSATVPSGGFAGTQYAFYMEGTVMAGEAAVIPVPAAVWLLGSGLLGLVGVARRRKTQA